MATSVTSGPADVDADVIGAVVIVTAMTDSEGDNAGFVFGRLEVVDAAGTDSVERGTDKGDVDISSATGETVDCEDVIFSFLVSGETLTVLVSGDTIGEDTSAVALADVEPIPWVDVSLSQIGPEKPAAQWQATSPELSSR